MLNKILITVSIILISFCGNAQKNLNDYKYIIIPTSFEFSKSDDQYRLNSLTKFLFNKYGYEAYFFDEIPEDLKNNRCLALKTSVSNKESGFFKTKLQIILKDCNDQVVAESHFGESRLKTYEKAYQEALRDAFETFKNADYAYNAPKTVTEAKAEEDVQTTDVVVKEEDVTKISEPKAKTTVVSDATQKETSELYYAQSIPNGFQLVDAEPKVVMVLLNSSAKNVFIVKDKNAIVYKKENQWVYSENNGTLISEKILNIKF